MKIDILLKTVRVAGTIAFRNRDVWVAPARLHSASECICKNTLRIVRTIVGAPILTPSIVFVFLI